MNYQDKAIEKSASIQAHNDDEHVVILKYNFKQIHSNKEEVDVHITFAPLLITFEKEVLSRLSSSYSNILLSNSSESATDNSNSFSQNESTSKDRNTQLRFECNHISIEVPLSSIKIPRQGDINLSNKLDNLLNIESNAALI